MQATGSLLPAPSLSLKESENLSPSPVLRKKEKKERERERDVIITFGGSTTLGDWCAAIARGAPLQSFRSEGGMKEKKKRNLNSARAFFEFVPETLSFYRTFLQSREIIRPWRSSPVKSGWKGIPTTTTTEIEALYVTFATVNNVPYCFEI